MSKTILLQGGPDDGRTVTVRDDAETYTTLRPIAPGKVILLGFDKGIYKATKLYNAGRQGFEWQGWQGDMN